MDSEQITANPPPREPRPPMTFLQQAELLEYLHGHAVPDGECFALTTEVFDADGRKVRVTQWLDAATLDDLWLTAARLRRMAPHEDAIRRLVTGQ